jgi:histone H3/H4
MDILSFQTSRKIFQVLTQLGMEVVDIDIQDTEVSDSVHGITTPTEGVLNDEESGFSPERAEDDADDPGDAEDETDEVDLDEEVEEPGDDREHDQENSDPIVEGQNDGTSNITGATSRKSRGPTCPLDLPIAVVRRIMKSAAPSRRFTPDLITGFARCAGVYGLYLLSACQEAAIESGRTTIRPIEVINGLAACGFPELAEETRLSMGISISTKRKKKTTLKRRN